MTCITSNPKNCTQCSECRQCMPVQIENKKQSQIQSATQFSPWVFVTHECSCRCEYCMIPKEIKSECRTMSSETFRRMCEITANMLEKGIYQSAHFRLSGGEPFIAFDNYKDIVTEYRKKYPRQMNFGILTNFVIFDEEIADWMELNDIGMQVSIDDIVNGKPLVNGQSSSKKVLENIQYLQTREIGFSFNTVLDTTKTKSLKNLANFISSFKSIDWGLNASYTENDPEKIKEVIDIFDECIFQAARRGFDIYNRLRFYNTVVGNGRGGCSAGVNSFGVGPNLEIWPCQSMCDKEPIGIFDENIKDTLENAPGNEWFRDRRMMSECSDCPVLGVCRGGCRSTHHDKEINDVVCQIRRNILGKLQSGYYTRMNQQNQQCGCGGSNNVCNVCTQCGGNNKACNVRTNGGACQCDCQCDCECNNTTAGTDKETDFDKIINDFAKAQTSIENNENIETLAVDNS